jgi:hypothetical protein
VAGSKNNNGLYVVPEVKIDFKQLFDKIQDPKESSILKNIKSQAVVAFAHLPNNIRADITGSFATSQALQLFTDTSHEALAKYFAGVDYDIQIASENSFISVNDIEYAIAFRTLQHNLDAGFVPAGIQVKLPFLKFSILGGKFDICLQEKPAIKMETSYNVRVNLKDGSIAFRNEECYQRFKKCEIYTPDLKEYLQAAANEAKANDYMLNIKKPGAYQHASKIIFLIRSHVKYRGIGFKLSVEDKKTFAEALQNEKLRQYITSLFDTKIKMLNEKNASGLSVWLIAARQHATLKYGDTDILSLLTTPMPDFSELPKPIQPQKKKATPEPEVQALSLEEKLNKTPRESVAEYVSRVKETLNGVNFDKSEILLIKAALKDQFRNILDRSRSTNKYISYTPEALACATNFYCSTLNNTLRDEHLSKLLSNALPKTATATPVIRSRSRSRSNSSSEASTACTSEKDTPLLTNKRAEKISVASRSLSKNAKFFPAQTIKLGQVTEALQQTRKEKSPLLRKFETRIEGMYTTVGGILGGLVPALCHYRYFADEEDTVTWQVVVSVTIGSILGYMSGKLAYNTPNRFAKMHDEMAATIIDNLCNQTDSKEQFIINYAKALTLTCSLENNAACKITLDDLTRYFIKPEQAIKFYRLKQWIVHFYKNYLNTAPESVVLCTLAMMEAVNQKDLQTILMSDKKENDLYFPATDSSINLIEEMENTFADLLNAVSAHKANENNENLTIMLKHGGRFSWQLVVAEKMLSANNKDAALKVALIDFHMQCPLLAKSVNNNTQLNAGTMLQSILKDEGNDGKPLNSSRPKELLEQLRKASDHPLWKDIRENRAMQQADEQKQVKAKKRI